MKKLATTTASCQPSVAIQLPLPMLSSMRALKDGFFDLCVLVDQQALEGQAEWERSVVDMEARNPIKDKNLLIDSSVVLCGVIIMFFIHSVPEIHLNLGWIAILGMLPVTGDGRAPDALPATASSFPSGRPFRLVVPTRMCRELG